VLAAALALAACSDDGADAERAASSVRVGVVTVAPMGEVGVSWVSENRLHVGGRAPQRLAARVNATLIGTLAPIAVRAPSGAALAYNSWRGRRPTLRIRDGQTGADSVLEEGAHSAAWANDSRLAYFKALKSDVGDLRRYRGHVVVRSSRRAAPQAWTLRAGRYVVAAWAGDNILFYRLGRSFPDLLVLDAPRRERLLAERSALVAVSPDGKRAFVSRYGASPPIVRVVELASGEEVARLQVETDAIKYVVESGSWAGDLVFAATTTGIAVFRISDARIALEQVLRAGATFPLGLSEPQAVAGGRVAAWGELEPRPRQAVAQAGVVECDPGTFRCVRGGVTAAVAPPRPVYNPSRP
jgi:hypothetical protein